MWKKWMNLGDIRLKWNKPVTDKYSMIPGVWSVSSAPASRIASGFSCWGPLGCWWSPCWAKSLWKARAGKGGWCGYWDLLRSWVAWSSRLWKAGQLRTVPMVTRVQADLPEGCVCVCVGVCVCLCVSLLSIGSQTHRFSLSLCVFLCISLTTGS